MAPKHESEEFDETAMPAKRPKQQSTPSRRSMRQFMQNFESHAGNSRATPTTSMTGRNEYSLSSPEMEESFLTNAAHLAEFSAAQNQSEEPENALDYAQMEEKLRNYVDDQLAKLLRTVELSGHEHTKSLLSKEKSERKSLHKTVQGLQSDFSSLKSSNKDLRRRKDGAVDRAENVADAAITSLWDRIDYDIKNVVFVLVKRDIKRDGEAMLLLETRLPRLPPDIFEDESQGGLFHFCLRAFIWSFVSDDILGGESPHWPGHAMHHNQLAKREMIG